MNLKEMPKNQDLLKALNSNSGKTHNTGSFSSNFALPPIVTKTPPANQHVQNIKPVEAPHPKQPEDLNAKAQPRQNSITSHFLIDNVKSKLSSYNLLPSEKTRHANEEPLESKRPKKDVKEAIRDG